MKRSRIMYPEFAGAQIEHPAWRVDGSVPLPTPRWSMRTTG
jgi:hypothetical protein